MKKVAQLLFIFSLLTVLISCTPKDSDNSASGVVLLKKLTSDVMGNHVVYNFNYKGTQLTKVTFDSYTPNHTAGYYNYTYANNLITEISKFDASNHNTEKSIFTYNNLDQLIQVVKLDLDHNTGTKTIYTYNADGTIDATSFKGTVSDQNNMLATSQKYYIQNNDIVKIDYIGDGLISTMEFQYDAAKNPTLNILGMDKIKLDAYNSEGLFGITKNLTKVKTNFLSNDSSEDVFELLYNDKNFPTSSRSSANSGGPYSYLYEYYN